MARNILQSSLQNAYFSIIFQIICRGITFCINAFIVRNVGREALGVMNVRLLLLESTLLFLAREAINRAALSATTQQKNKCTWPQLVNQMWLTVPICILLSTICLYVWLNLLSPVDEILQDQYRFGCYAVALSCVIELCADTPVFVSQVFCFVKLKIVLDFLHIFIRSVIFIMIVIRNHEIAIYAFAVAQLASAFTIIFGHYGFFYMYIKRFKEFQIMKEKKEIVNINEKLYKNMEDFPFNNIKEMLPGVLPKENEPIFNKELQVLTLSFVKQGVLKQILTEGEKYVMSVSPVLSFSEQATYDIVNNLGSLAARFIFRPIEDSTYFYFTQTVARDVKLEEQNKEKVTEASFVLTSVCRTVTSIGLIAFIFGQSYSGSVLYIYGGADFVAGGLPEKLLRWHCLAILLMAVNGITEGYMFATNTSKDIDKYNYYMAVYSILFLLFSYVLTNIFGPVGFILANCMNMISRILYSSLYIRRQYKHINLNPLEGIFPGKLFVISLVIIGSICKISEATFSENSMLKHFAVGLICGMLTVISWCMENQNLVKLFFNKYGTKMKFK